MTRILIVGGSGGIGLAAVGQALARGHDVRAFARSAERIDIAHPKLEKRVGDSRLADDVAAALDGVDVVIQALGVTARELIFGTVSLFSEATRILLPAMQAAGVRRLVSVTGFGAGDSRRAMSLASEIPFRLVLSRAYDDKTVQEELIRASDRDWVIVRPVILTNGPRTGDYKVLVDPQSWRGGLISRADVADFLVRQVDDDGYLGKTPVLAY